LAVTIPLQTEFVDIDTGSVIKQISRNQRELRKMENTTFNGSSYKEDQIDALREIGNIGASHASTALTTMLH
jgi:chemotaxis protein CheY-P-specific phosphatase CheC